jgi:hypothetical protein
MAEKRLSVLSSHLKSVSSHIVFKSQRASTNNIQQEPKSIDLINELNNTLRPEGIEILGKVTEVSNFKH